MPHYPYPARTMPQEYQGRMLGGTEGSMLVVCPTAHTMLVIVKCSSIPRRRNKKENVLDFFLLCVAVAVTITIIYRL
jgi:hypothetical protein